MSSSRPSRRSKKELTVASDDEEPTSRKRAVKREETEISNDDGRPSREKTPPSISPLVPSDNRETDNLCPATNPLNIVDIQKTENHFETGSNSDPPMCPSWHAIPWPPLERICHHLYNPNDGSDLANFAKVSHHYNNGVMKFMSGPNNRPGIEKVEVWNNGEDGLLVDMVLFTSNFPFYGLASLDKERFKQRRNNNYSPILQVTLTGPEDPIIEKVICLLSSAISTVKIFPWFSSWYTWLCEQLLRSSTIGALEFQALKLNETTAHVVLSIASHAKKIEVRLNYSEYLCDPELDSITLLSSVFLSDNCLLSLFGLPISFWENYLNEKLSNGSLEWVEVGRMGRYRKITQAPIGLNPNESICSLKWEKR